MWASHLRQKHSQTTTKAQSLYDKTTVKVVSCDFLLTVCRKCAMLSLEGGVYRMDFENQLQEIENAISIRYNPKYPVVMANKLIRAKKDRLTTFEAKLVRLAISNIVELDTKLKTYTISVAELANFFKVDSSNIYREVPNLAKSLLSKKIYIPTGTYDRQGRENFELFNWVSYVKYENGSITLRLNDSLSPYLLGLDRLFTMYGYDTVLALPKETAIILYELLISFEGLRTNNITVKTYPELDLDAGEFVLEIDFLRKYFECEDKYPNTSDFINRVIEYNLNIIMVNTLARIQYRTVKKGRAIKYIVFKFIGWLDSQALEKKIARLKLKAGMNNAE